MSSTFILQQIGLGGERPGFSLMLKSRTWRVLFMSTLENLTLGWGPQQANEAEPYAAN